MSGEEKKVSDAGAGTAAASVPSEQPYLDEHTTEPNAPQQSEWAAEAKSEPEKWQMPKPKFQQSSGYLPQGYLKQVQMVSDETSPDAPSDDGEQLTAERITGIDQQQPDDMPTAPAIEPQPDLADQLLPDEPSFVASETSSPSKSGSRLPALLLGLAGILVFLAVFLAAVYYFFLAKSSGGSTF